MLPRLEIIHGKVFPFRKNGLVPILYVPSWMPHWMMSTCKMVVKLIDFTLNF